MQTSTETAPEAYQSVRDQPNLWEPPPTLDQLAIPPFKPHRLIRGGHLQTVVELKPRVSLPSTSVQRWVQLEDGDRLAMFDDMPVDWRPGDPSLLVLHGLCGCSESPYMVRLTTRFGKAGVRVFRLNHRGCGVGVGAAKQITHAGRSDDVIAAITEMARLTSAGPIALAGISLGGNQLLRAFGHAQHKQAASAWQARIHRIAAISPPINLKRCSDNMQRRILRPYNRFFIRHLLDRVPPGLREHPIIQDARRRIPRTMRELDDRVTAPLAGYDSYLDYYHKTAASSVLDQIDVPTLILSAKDDPIVPADCFTSLSTTSLPSHLRLLLTSHGGHVGFIGHGDQRHWMDGVLERWFAFDRLR